MASDSDYQETATTVIQIRGFSQRQRYDFIIAEALGEVNLELQIKVYPHTNNCISVYISKETVETLLSDFQIICIVNVIDVDGTLRFPKSFAYNHQDKSDVFIVGLEECFNRNKLLEDSAVFLPDDILSLHCELSYKGKHVSQPIRKVGRELKYLSDKISENIRNLANQFKNSAARRHLQQQSMLVHFTTADIFRIFWFIIREFLTRRVFRIGEHTIFKSKSDNFDEPMPWGNWIVTVVTMHGIKHRILFEDEEKGRRLGNKLCKESPVFRRMLKGPTLERLTRRVEIVDFDSSTFAAFLHFVQFGEVKWPEDIGEVYSLYEMADKYAVMKLMTACSRHLVQNINSENVMDISILAIMHCDRILKKAIASYFRTKGILIIGKTGIHTLYQLAKTVHLRKEVAKRKVAVEYIMHTRHINKRVILIKKFEEASILYEIADECEVNDMMEECVRYMKQSATQEDVPMILNLAKRCHSHMPLAFVVDFIIHNTAENLSIEQQETLQSLFSSKTRSSSSSSSESLNHSLEDDEVSYDSEFEFYH